MRSGFLIFARQPVPGRVKTRLIPALGAAGAAALHERMCARMLTVVSQFAPGAVELWCTPDSNSRFFRAAGARYQAQRYSQHGADLGEIMEFAARSALRRWDSVVLLGTDCVELDAPYLSAAVQALQEVQVVIGPAVDGGYVLLAMRDDPPELFGDMPWGTGEVLARTRDRLQHCGATHRLLAPLHDIDRPEDLHLLPGQWLDETGSQVGDR